MHLLVCGTRIKSEGANHQHFLWKNDDYSKTEKENKNRRHGFGKKLSDNKPAKFQLTRFRGCRLGVENVRLTFRNFRSEKTRKLYFLRHLTDLTHNRIITPNHLAITIGVWQVICSRPKLYAGRIRITIIKLSFHVYRPRKLKTFKAVAWLPPIAQKPRNDARFIANALLFSAGNAKLV